MPCRNYSLKKISILLVCLVMTEIAFAQKRNVYFMRNSGKVVSTKDSAEYFRVVSEPDSGTNLYNIKEYYANGDLKLAGKSSQIDYNLFKEQVISFFHSGNKRWIANYEKGHVTGTGYSYFPNGQLHSIWQITTFANTTGGSDDIYTITSSYDSLGKAMVVDGNGHFVDYDEEFKTIKEEGDVVNAFMDGLWKNTIVIRDPQNDKSDTLFIKEQYHNGRLVSGTSTDKSGTTYTYVQKEVKPDFPGGEAAFGRFLQRTLQYPVVAKNNNIQGRVYIDFTVEPDGRLTGFKAVRDAGSGTAEESIRVLKLSPRWIPGKQYGKPVSISYTVPINFTLGSN